MLRNLRQPLQNKGPATGRRSELYECNARPELHPTSDILKYIVQIFQYVVSIFLRIDVIIYQNEKKYPQYVEPLV